MLLSVQQKLQEFENPKLSAEIQETVRKNIIHKTVPC